jgi:thiaminase
MIHNNNTDLFDALQRNLSKLVDAIIYHPYINALEKKQISKDKLEIFVCEQFQIILNDKRNFAFMISKTSNDTTTKIFIDCLNAELTALENLMVFAEALDINRINLESYEPLSGCQAYTNYLTKLAAYGSDAEILAALLIDLPVWGNNCGKISYIMQENYGFTRKSCKFLDNFAIPLAVDVISKSKELIMSSINDSPLNVKKIRIATRMIIDYELTFWDTIYKHSIIKQ